MHFFQSAVMEKTYILELLYLFLSSENRNSKKKKIAFRRLMLERQLNATVGCTNSGNGCMSSGSAAPVYELGDFGQVT